MTEKFLTSEQVAQALQVHPFTVLKLIKQKRLRAIKIGRMYRIKESDLEHFLEKSDASPKAEEAAVRRKPTGASKAEEHAPKIHKPSSSKDHFVI